MKAGTSDNFVNTTLPILLAWIAIGALVGLAIYLLFTH